MRARNQNLYLTPIALLVVSMGGAAHASDAGLEVTLELSDRTRKVAPVTLTLSLEGAEGCASVDDRTSAGELHVQVCREDGDPERPLLGFHVDRSLHLEKGTERRQFRVKARLTRGQRQLIGRFGEGQHAMELAASLPRSQTKS